MTDYTPTTDEVREAYLDRKDFEDALSFVDRRGDEEAGAEFNRWLASVKAEAWDEGCRAGLDAGITVAEVMTRVKPLPIPPPLNPYRKGQTDE